MKKRNISRETELKVLQLASTILRMHAEIAGCRICQDWSAGDDVSPLSVLSDQECDDLDYNFQIENSGLDDYDLDHNPMGDEMSASFVLAEALDNIREDLESETLSRYKKRIDRLECGLQHAVDQLIYRDDTPEQKAYREGKRIAVQVLNEGMDQSE